MPNRRLKLALLACLALAAGCGKIRSCRGGGDKPIERPPVGAPNADLPRELSPPPEPPQVELPPGATPGPLAVVAARPKGELRGEVRPTITFSKPVKTLAAIEAQRGEDSQAPVARIDPPIDGEWRWLGSASVELVPKGPVPHATSFTVTVPKGLQAIDGSQLPADYTFTFNTPRPRLQDVSPVRGYRWLTPKQTIRLLFNQPLKDSELEAALSFQVAGEDKPWKAKVVSRTSIAEERRREEEKARAEGRRMPLPPEPAGFAATSQQIRYEIAAEKPFPLSAQVTLIIAASLRGEQGPLPMDKEERLSWSTYGPLRLLGARMCAPGDRCPHGPLRIFTSNLVEVASLKDRLVITPAVELDWERAELWTPSTYEERDLPPHVSLPGRFRPGTEYRIQVGSGVVDQLGQHSTEPLQRQVRTDDLPPALLTGGGQALIEASTGPRLPVDVVNLKTLDVELWRLLPEEAAVALGVPPWTDKPLISRPPDMVNRVELKYARNERRAHAVDLTRLFGLSRTGMALVSLSSPNLDKDDAQPRRVIAQVTDLAVHLKVGPRRSLAYVTRLSSAAPVQGAELTAYDSTGRQVWSGRTDAEGLADLPGVVEMGLSQPENAWEVPFLMMAATQGGDTAVTSNRWDQGVSAGTFGLEEGWEGAAPEPSGFVFTERGIYRPGDKVFIKGVARFRQVGELKLPAPGSTLGLTVTNSSGDKVSASDVKVSRYGTFSAEVSIPAGSPTGHYFIEASGRTETGPLSFYGSFRVEEYRAPQFKVEARAARPSLLAGEPLEAHVFGRYLFGAAMAGAKTRWSVHSQSAEFAPHGLEGFAFTQETWWGDDEQPPPAGGFFASGEGRLDSGGSLAVKAGAVQAPGERTWTYTFEAEVEDVSRQAVAGRTSVTVHPAAYYAGLRAPVGFPEAGQEFQVDALVVDTEGRRVAGRKLEVTVSSRSWKSVRRKEAGGGFTTVSEPVEEKVHSCELKSGADAPVPCKVKPARPGLYVVRATVADDQKRKHTASVGLYVLGPGFVSWQRTDTERIELVPDKTTYDVGDVAKVLIKSPYPSATGLLTVEREGVLSRRPLRLAGSVTTVEIPITEEMVPNVFASVLLLHPRAAPQGGAGSGDDAGSPGVRIGLARLGVERRSKRLAVLVTTDHAEYRPGQEITATVELRDHRSRPVPAEVTLFAVDEAVLSLTDYQTPDPLAAIFPDRPLSVRLGEPLLHLVRRRRYGEKGEPAGGGGGGEGEGLGLRTRFQATAYFNPAIETGPDGKASVRFKLPDNLTTFRIMAVAVTAGDRFGAGDTSIQVNKPLLAMPALPRFARVGDRFEAGVVVHAYTAEEGMVTVAAAIENGRLLGPQELKVAVSPGSPREVRFPFSVDRPGVAVFRFRAHRGKEWDGVEERIPVEAAAAVETVAIHGDTADQRVEGLELPQGAIPGVGGLEVSLASTSMGNLQEGMRQLVEYPYGCLEQQASRLVPFVALKEISGEFGLAWPGPDKQKLDEQRALNNLMRAFLFDPLDVTTREDPDEVVAATIRSLLKLQEPDGSFRFWGSSSCPSSWGSAWAALALHRARQAGYTVDPERLLRAEGYLANVAGGRCNPCEPSCPDETRLFAVWTLARMGRPKPSFYGELYAARGRLPLFSRALLADAMYTGGGDRGRARDLLLDDVLGQARESPRGVHLAEVQPETYAALWHSDVRTTAAALLALTGMEPEHAYVAKMARYLGDVRRGDGAWRSTQEAAFSLMALTEVLRTKERAVPRFTAQVLLDDKPVMEQEFRGRSLEVKSSTWGIDALAQARAQELTFEKKGPGVLYYSAHLRYVPGQAPVTPLDRGLVVQRWFEPYTGGGQATKFYAGDLVRVRVRVATSQERHWVALEVPLPAGLEPADVSLATTARQTRAPHEEGRAPGYEYESAGEQVSGAAEPGAPVSPWAYSFWSPFNHIEQRDTRIVLFADHLPPGVHAASFIARATTPGTFVLRPARGELMYEPEVLGRSEGGTFEVVFPPAVSQR